MDRKIVLENGQEYTGSGFGADGQKVLEIVFNTSMAGYQEILSDPSYTDQAVVMTYPLIGNYGMAAEDYESERPALGALIVREYNDEPSSFRSGETLDSAMKRFGIPGVQGIDTRKLNRTIRDEGSQKVLITGRDMPREEALSLLRKTPLPRDQVSRVSAASVQELNPEGKRHVVLIDCGAKRNILRSLIRRDCRITAVPWDTPAKRILACHPDGVLISNGPGNPEDVPETIRTVRKLVGECPVFGICLGHQILSLACGARTYKLKFGHRGGNHPVRNLRTGRIEITSQNHSYAADAASLARTPLEVTHLNLLDGTVEGVQSERLGAFSVQYHPESAPGPQDSAYLFDQLIGMM